MISWFPTGGSAGRDAGRGVPFCPLSGWSRQAARRRPYRSRTIPWFPTGGSASGDAGRGVPLCPLSGWSRQAARRRPYRSRMIARRMIPWFPTGGSAGRDAGRGVPFCPLSGWSRQAARRRPYRSRTIARRMIPWFPTGGSAGGDAGRDDSGKDRQASVRFQAVGSRWPGREFCGGAFAIRPVKGCRPHLGKTTSQAGCFCTRFVLSLPQTNLAI